MSTSSEWKTRNIFSHKDYDYETQAILNIAVSKSIDISSGKISSLLTFISINSSGTHRNITLSYSQLFNLVYV